MFQAPLFYIVGAVVYRGLMLVTAAGTAALWLRWLTLLCGVAQVELCYRAGRLVFPGRDDLQSLAVLFGGLVADERLYVADSEQRAAVRRVLGPDCFVVLADAAASRRPLRNRADSWRWDWCSDWPS